MLHVLKAYKYTLKIDTVCYLAIKMLKIIKTLHRAGLVHRDIKPDNIVLGQNKHSSSFYLIDFGLSKKYMTDRGKHVVMKRDQPFIGSPGYASCASHEGVTLSRKDDIESLFYTLVFLIKGDLPWYYIKNPKHTKEQRMEEMKKLKLNCTTSKICHRLPSML